MGLRSKGPLVPTETKTVGRVHICQGDYIESSNILGLEFPLFHSIVARLARQNRYLMHDSLKNTNTFSVFVSRDLINVLVNVKKKQANFLYISEYEHGSQ